MARLTFKTATAQLKEMGFNIAKLSGKDSSRTPYMIGRIVDGEAQTWGCNTLDHAMNQAKSIKRNEQQRRLSGLAVSLMMNGMK